MILGEKDRSYSAIPLLFDEEKKILKSLGRNGRPFPGCFVKRGGKRAQFVPRPKKGSLTDSTDTWLHVSQGYPSPPSR